MVKSVLSKGNTDFFLEENMMNILETRNLKKYYGKGDTLVKALDGVDLNVEDGEFVAIVGTSGSGKSTLLHMLGGLDRPTSGTVIVDGKDIFSLKDEALTIFRRRRIGFVGGEEGTRTTTARLASYSQTLKSLSLPFDPSLISLSNYYAPDGYQAMTRLLNRPEARPTAVVCINDAVAQGAIRAIADKGLRVPEDISVVSCDQFPSGEYSCPRLTTLDQQNSYLGRMSIMTLIGAIHHDSECISISHEPRLIIRESCGAALGYRFKE